jgi:hypothetical protein
MLDVENVTDVKHDTTPWSLVILEKLTVAQLLMKIPEIYGIRTFISVFIKTGHWT